MATNIRFVANYGTDTVAVKAAPNGAICTTSSSSLPNYTRLQDGSSTNLAGVDASGYLSSWSMGYYYNAGYVYPRTIELDNGSVGAFMGRVVVNIAAQNLTALKVSRTSSANGPSNPFYNAILGANGSSIVSAANPLPTTATITGDVNVDVNSANGTCLIGKTSGGDFTTTYTSATTITIGAIPYSHTFTAEDIVSIVQIASDGSVTNTYTRDDKAMSIAGSVITVTGATFSATDKFIIFSCIPRRIYIDQTTPGTTNNVYVTTVKPDGTNTMPSLDTVGRAGFIKITDGTETANVNASNQLETAEANSATIAGDTTSIDGKITACNTGAIAGTVTANAGTNLNTSTLAIESGGNLATIAGDTTSIDGKITACNTGAVTISAALPAGASKVGDIGLIGNTAADGSGTDYHTLVDASGHLQVDIISGGSSGEQYPDAEVVGAAKKGNLILGTDGSNYQILSVDVSGHLQVDVLSVPTTSVTGTFWQATQPVSGTVTANAGTNLNTSTLAIESGGNLATIAGDTTSIDGKVTACNTGAVTISSALPAGASKIGDTGLIGNTAADGSGTDYHTLVDASGHLQVDIISGGSSGEQYPDAEVVGAAKKGNLILGTDGSNYQILSVDASGHLQVDVLSSPTTSVTGTFWQATQPVSGTVTANAGTNLNTSTLATESGGNLATIAGDTTSIDGKVTACNTGAVVVSSGAITETNSGAIKTAVELLSATTPTLYAVTMTTADTEYSQALPANTKKVEVRCRDIGYNTRFAFAAGKVATPTDPYRTLSAGETKTLDGLNLTSKTLYIACATAGQIMEIECWS